MTCDRAREWIIDNVVVGLSPEDKIAFEEHVASCEGCGALARQYRQLWSDLPAAAVLRAPEHGWSALEAKIHSEQAGEEAVRSPTRSQAASWTTWVPHAAVAAALVGIGVLVGMGIGRDAGSTVAADSTRAAGDTTMPQFVLLFYEVPGNTELRARASNDINTWARGQFTGGVVVNSAEMADSASWAGSAPGAIAAGPRVTHYILVHAINLAHAERIAASAPVAAYGGVIEVRAIDP